MKEGRFRQDLYFCLNVIRIHMPKLAERREDIPLLVAEFIKKHGHIRLSHIHASRELLRKFVSSSSRTIGREMCGSWRM